MNNYCPEFARQIDIPTSGSQAKKQNLEENERVHKVPDTTEK
jgi:hypothetical protein